MASNEIAFVYTNIVIGGIQTLLIRLLSVISQFSGIFVIQFSPIKTQKKQPKLQFYDIWVPKCHRIFEVLFRIGGSIIFVHMKTDSIVVM